jgi:glycosyltransferase involved in cell wall biosynthesis
MTRLLIINYAFPPFGGAASRRVAKLVKYLGRLGYRSIVITAPRIINPLRDEVALKDVPPDAVVIRTRSLEPLPPLGKDMPRLLALRRLLNVPMVPDVSLLWAICAVPPALSAARKHAPAAVLCSAPEFTSFLVGAAVKAVTGLPLILDYRDEWSFHPVKMQSLKGSSARKLKQSLELRLERRLAHYADRVIANTEAFKKEFIARLGLDPGRVRVISNGFDPEDFPENAPAAAGPDGPVIVAHLGSVDHESMLPAELLSALDRAGEAQGKKIELRLIGNIYPELRRRMAERASSRLAVVMPGFLPAREALAELSVSRLNLLILEDFPGKERYHNLKLFDYLAAGAPILVYGPKQSMIAELAVKSGLGRVVERGDEKGLTGFFADFLAGKIKTSPDRGCIESFSWENQAGKVAELIEEAQPSNK